ncbi:MAG: 23S rRNA (pseudouridine(1915)-N(3))-methyltransferase RlmH [Acidobacteriota bacterium]
MKLQFIWIGKTKNAAIRELANDYLERLKKYCRVEITELRDRDDAGGVKLRLIEKEGEEILQHLEADAFLIALDERGREMTSQQFAEFFEKHRLAGTKQLTFVIGGHLGLAEKVKKRANLTLALSRMTLTHELARIFLLEQAYRAFAILHGSPYQK